MNRREENGEEEEKEEEEQVVVVVEEEIEGGVVTRGDGRCGGSLIARRLSPRRVRFLTKIHIIKTRKRTETPPEGQNLR